MDNTFEKLLAIDVSAHIEKKGKFSYLSWPWAVTELRKADPKASWRVIHFYGDPHDSVIQTAQQPYMRTDCGYFVEVEVIVNDVKLSQIHPVLDNYNKPIAEPNAVDINTSIQRCLVKAIALHGLGLSIYAGEDLPPGSPKAPKKPNQAQETYDEEYPEEPPKEPKNELEVRKSLKKALNELCSGEPETMKRILKECSLYKGKFMDGSEGIEKASDAWCKTTLGKIKKRLEGGEPEGDW